MMSFSIFIRLSSDNVDGNIITSSIEPTNFNDPPTSLPISMADVALPALGALVSTLFLITLPLFTRKADRSLALAFPACTMSEYS